MDKEILDKLDALGVSYETEEHEPVFTVAESQDHLKGRTAVKNLLLQEEKGGRLVFVIMAGEPRLDTKKLSATIGFKKLQFAKPEGLKAILGVEPGSASLFCLFLDSSKDVLVVVDEYLLDKGNVGFHPLRNDGSIYIDGENITKVLDSAGHKYTISSDLS